MSDEKTSRYTGPTLGDIGGYVKDAYTDVMQPVPSGMDNVREVKYLSPSEVSVNRVKMPRARLEKSTSPVARRILADWPAQAQAQAQTQAQTQGQFTASDPAAPQLETPVPQTQNINVGQPTPTQRTAAHPQSRYLVPPRSGVRQGPVRTTTTGPVPEAAAALARRTGEGGTLEQIGQARRTEMELAAMQLEDQVQFAQRKAQIAQDAQNAQADLKDRRVAAAKEWQTKRERVMESVNNMELKDYWADKSTESKVIAGIGLALGAYASTARGGPNQAMQIIDSAIARDLDIQKGNIAKGRARLEDLNGAYAQIKLDFEDEQRAENIYYVSAYDKVLKDLETFKANAATDTMIQNVQNIEAEVQDARAAEEQRFMEGIQRSVTSTEVPFTTPGITHEQARSTALKEEPYDRDKYVAQAGGNALDKQDAKAVMDGYNAIDSVNNLIDRISEVHDDAGGVEWTEKSTNYQKMFGLVQQLNTKLAVINNLGAISKEDKVIVEGQSGGVTLDWMNYASVSRDELKKSMLKSEELLQTRVRPVSMSTVPSLYQGQQRHPWGQVIRNPTGVRALKSLEGK